MKSKDTSRRGSSSRRYLFGAAGAAAVIALALAAFASASSQKTSVVPVTFKEGPAAPFAATRFDGEYNLTDKRIYFTGFRAGDDSTDGSVWYYDTVAKTYVDTGVDMAVPVSNYHIAALKDASGKLGYYLFGGRDANANIVTTVQAFYPATQTTKVFTKDPWPGMTPAGCISLPAMGVAVTNNTAVVAGGMSFSSNGCSDDQSKETWLFDPTAAAGSHWKKGPPLHVARGYITMAKLGSKIYAIGGDTNDAGTLVPNATVESWKFGAAKWSNGPADLPQACDESQAFGFTQGPLAGTITLAGCGQWPQALPDVLQYDSASNTWAADGALNEARRNHAGAVIGGTRGPMYILGGYSGDGSTVLSSSEIGKASTKAPVLSPSARPAAPAGSASTN